MIKNDRKRFFNKVEKTKACWNWKASVNKGGYGRFSVDSNFVSAHRFAYSLKNGNIPNGLWVLHKCDNRKCVNPSHLFLGTAEDNNRDCSIKARTGKNKLTKEEVLKIRKDFSCGVTTKDLSTLYSVHRNTIYAIINKRNWKFL